MKKILFLSFLLFQIEQGISAHQRISKKATTTSFITLLEANERKLLPGIIPKDGNAKDYIRTELRIIIIWNNTASPQSFFWRPQKEQWMATGVHKIHSVQNTKGDPYQLGYTTKKIELQNIHKGDTLELMPYLVDTNLVPKEITALPIQSLFFTTNAATKWQYLYIQNISQKKPVAFP